MSHSYRIEDILFRLEKQLEETLERLNKVFFIESIAFFLHNNYAMFQFEFYHQIPAMLMVTKVAPTITNVTNGFLEKTKYKKSLLKLMNPSPNT